MNFTKKPELYELTEAQYESLKKQGLLWAFYPEATGVCDIDLDLMTDKEKIERVTKLVDDLIFLPDAFVDLSNHNVALNELKVLSKKWAKK
jgi:hypothetical protein